MKTYIYINEKETPEFKLNFDSAPDVKDILSIATDSDKFVQLIVCKRIFGVNAYNEGEHYAVLNLYCTYYNND